MKVFLYNVHLALFVRMDDTITCSNASVTSKSRHLLTRQQAESLQTGKEKSSVLEEVRH